MAIGFFFVLSLSGSNQESNELRSGQAKRPTVHNDKKKKSAASSLFSGFSSRGQNFDNGPNNDDGIDEDVEMDLAKDKFERVVREQISMNENMLSEEVDKVMEKMKKSLSDLLDDSDITLEGEAVDELVDDIRVKLDKTIKDYVKTETDAMLEGKKEEFENDLDYDAEESKKEALNDEEGQKQDIIADLRQGVDDICEKARDKIKKWSGEVEKDVLEQTLKDKTSKEYTATIYHDKVTEITEGTAKKASKKSTKKVSKKKASEEKKSTKKTTKKKVVVQEDDDDDDDDDA